MDGLLSNSLLNNELLFPDNTIMPLYTEGVENVAWDTAGYTPGNGTATKESDHLHLATEPAFGARTFVTTSPVDISGIKKLWITWEASCGTTNAAVFLMVTDIKTDDSNNAVGILRYDKTSFSPRSEYIDVSALSGSYYIIVQAASASYDAINYLNAYKIWGEK